MSDTEHEKIMLWQSLPFLTLKGYMDRVWSVVWSLTGNQIASAAWDQTVIIWEAASGAKVSELKGHTGHVYSVTWSPKGDQIAWVSGYVSIIWDAASGAQ